MTTSGGQVGGEGGGGGLQHYGPRGRNGLHVVVLVRGRPRAGAEASGEAIGWNGPPREDWSTIHVRSQRLGEQVYLHWLVT